MYHPGRSRPEGRRPAAKTGSGSPEFISRVPMGHIAPCHSSPASSSLTAWPKTWLERTKRMYSDNLRSSACARRDNCSSRFSGRRSFSSSVHLSAMIHTQKKPARARSPAGIKSPAVDTGRRETRLREASMSGRLFRLEIIEQTLDGMDRWFLDAALGDLADGRKRNAGFAGDLFLRDLLRPQLRHRRRELPTRGGRRGIAAPRGVEGIAGWGYALSRMI